MSIIRLNAYCPMGCGRTVEVGENGTVGCVYSGCPHPMALHEIINDRQTEHLVEFDSTGFNVRHPLRERIGDRLLHCTVHSACGRHPPGEVGTYRAFQINGEWRFERA